MKNILRFIIVLLISTSINAQERELNETQKEEIKVQLEQYFEKLNLTDEQKTSYEAIVKQYQGVFEFVKESGLSREEKIKEVQRIQADKDAEIKQILSEEQYTIYLDFKSTQKSKISENYSGEFAEYFERLNLSEEQKPKFIEISKRYGTQLKNLKHSSKSRFGKYKEYKSIQDNKASEMRMLLTKEQYKIYEEIQEEIQKKIKEKRR